MIPRIPARDHSGVFLKYPVAADGVQAYFRPVQIFDHWLTDDEMDRIRTFARTHPLGGDRRLTFLMLDVNVVACSPASVERILKDAHRLAGSSPVPGKKGTGFVQPTRAHEHWHIDVSYLNIAGTFDFLCSALDGFSRAIVPPEIRETMEESDVEIILQRARECHPGVTPRIISDNGPQLPRRVAGAGQPLGHVRDRLAVEPQYLEPPQ